MQQLKKAENKAERVMASEEQPVNGAGNVPRESLTLNIDCDAANVESDVTPEEKHARVDTVVPGVAQDQASTPAQGVVVVGGESQAKDVEHDLGWDRHTGGEVEREPSVSRSAPSRVRQPARANRK